MIWNVAWTLAWLLGVFWQTGEAALNSQTAYAVCLALSVAGVVCSWWWRRRPPAPIAQRFPLVRWAWLSLGAMAIAMMSWASTGWRASTRMLEAMPDAWVGRDVQIQAQVEGLPQAVPGGVLLDARVLAWHVAGADVSHWPRHLSLHMPLQGGALPQSGQRWQFTVQLHAPDGLSNPGGFDGTLSFFERGVRAVGRVLEKGHVIRLLDERPEHAWQGLIDRLRQRIRTVIFEHVPDQRAAGILAGLSVGDQSAIEREDWDLFRQTGIAHLVSISGAHIAMFGWMAALLVRRAWSSWPRGMHRWPAPDVAMWAALLASGLYALLSGWGVPAQRTVLMMAVVCALRARGRRWPWPLVCLISAVVLTAMDPWSIRQVGFWLSYMAVAVLLSYGLKETSALAGVVPLNAGVAVGETMAGAPLARYVQGGLHRLWGAGVNIMRIQCLITLALMPLSLVVFQQASISSLLANLIAIPVFTIGITPLSLMGTIWPPCWDLAVWVINLLMTWLADLVRLWPAMAVSPVLPWWVALCGVLAGCALALPMDWRWRLGLLPFGLPLVYLPQIWHMLPAPRAGTFSLVAADVGQGTAVLVRTARHALLFDTGPRIGEQLNAGDRTLLPMFRAMGVNKLDVLMISHQDTDHVGGADAILRHMPIDRMVSSLAATHALLQRPGTSGGPVPHVACESGLQWQWDGVLFEVLHPGAKAYAHRDELSPNAISCVLKVSALGSKGTPGRSVLLTGDIESAQEAELLAHDAGHLRSTLLIAAHHGSQTSSTEAFLKAVEPEQVVIQVGRRNRYGHPSPPVLARYEALGLNWVATPDCGAYVWFSDELGSPPRTEARSGDKPRLGACWRPGHHRYWDQPSPMALSQAAA